MRVRTFIALFCAACIGIGGSLLQWASVPFPELPDHENDIP